MKIKIHFSPPSIDKNDIAAVSAVLRSGWVSMGLKTVEFEKKFADYCHSKYAVAVNSCTSALFLSLKALDIKKGDEVITSPFTFSSTVNVIEHLGAKPVFVDIKEDDFNIDYNLVEKKISKKTKAILPVHYGGRVADMDRINKIAKQHKLFVVEDAAHALGSSYNNGERVGSSNNLTCFSFYATKNITTGEGGMITTNDRKIYEKIKILRLHGLSKQSWSRYLKLNDWHYDLLTAGYKMNMTDINAALGISQLKRLELFKKSRKIIADRYNIFLRAVNGITLPNLKTSNQTCYHLYPILIDKISRDLVVKKLAQKGIMTSVHFIPLYRMAYYKKKYKHSLKDFPVCEKVYKRIITLPIYPGIKMSEQKYISEEIKKIIK